MTRFIAPAASFFGVVALIYLFGAFIAWDFNAGNWDPFGRAVAAFVAMLFGVVAAMETSGGLR